MRLMRAATTRRDWLKGSLLLALSAPWARWDGPGTAYAYCLAQVAALPATLPPDRYVPFDWAVAELRAGGDGLPVRWPQPVAGRRHATFRLTSATDVREACAVAVKTTVSGRVIGVLDVRFAMYLQPFELPIPAADLPAVLAEGLTLTLVAGSKPFWFFTAAASAPAAPAAYLPHLLVYEEHDTAAWRQRLLSLESVQAFGWMQGCVWDGLHEMRTYSPQAKRVLEQQLTLFFEHNNLVYADLNNQKASGIINSVESILPFALLAQISPSHPYLQTAIAFCQAHANAAGVVADGTGADRLIKTEECYTVSYPLAVLAAILHRPELAELAIQTLWARVRRLDLSTGIYQRTTEQGLPVFGNWARGVAWYLLGLVKTLAQLPASAHTHALTAVLHQAVATVTAYQQPNGLWYCFLDQPATGYETSGTAGIAAALAYGRARGLLPNTVGEAAQKARSGLARYLTPDGYLTGTAQGNKGGLALQTEGFRVISPYTLGFLAHLDAYLA